MSPRPPIELLIQASEKLGELCAEVVFLGGAVVSLLATEKGGAPPRFTKDVDVAIELGGTLLDVYDLDRRLRDLGFRNDMEGPFCRYLHGESVIDVIPVISESLGDINSWYPLAIETARPYTLPNGVGINVIAPECFLGTKLMAFRSATREHHDDIILSRDFGDIIRVIDGRPNIAINVLEARDDLRMYLQGQFSALLKDRYIHYAIEDHVDPGREDLVMNRIRAFLP